MRESLIELYLNRKVKLLGGLSFKWVSPGRRGVPDRIVLLHGEVWFIEVKAEGGSLSALQAYTLNQLKEAGANVYVAHGRGGVDEFLKHCKAGV